MQTCRDEFKIFLELLSHEFSLCSFAVKCEETTLKQTKNQLMAQEKKDKKMAETHLPPGGVMFFLVCQNRVKMEF
jgi:hypothetical protein